jgi:MazG family protein
MEPLDRLESLVAIMDRLREPGGCPWDREQDFPSLRPYVLEEAYEVAEAIDAGDPNALREELGDLLFQIVFLARLGREKGHFTLEQVIGNVAEKLIRRHPHVFGSATATTADEVARNWEEIKRREKGAARPRSRLDGIPAALPAMLRARLLADKAGQIGFDWTSPEPVMDKIAEELQELRQAAKAGNREATREELGDLLFSAVMLARHLGVDPEGALAATNRKFRARFEAIEADLARRGLDPAGVAPEELERLWEQAKRGEP